eukprot:TRINITY_DN956_c4_g1_i1.p1 TRINITY_DN956_c4_g1~~TRINITY_DN956_c4_g1_i1.p1  ORF type:complete len:448 (+),score=41.52 TRINITY_DN956_c4_g1_i1:42-1346(+)
MKTLLPVLCSAFLVGTAAQELTLGDPFMSPEIQSGNALTVTLTYNGPAQDTGVLFTVDTVPHSEVPEFSLSATVNSSVLGGNTTISAGMYTNSIFMMSSYFTLPAEFTVDIYVSQNTRLVVTAYEPGIRYAPLQSTFIDYPVQYESSLSMASYHDKGAWTTTGFKIINDASESFQFVALPPDNIQIFEGPSEDNMTNTGSNGFYFTRATQFASPGYPDTLAPEDICPFMASSPDANFICKNGTSCADIGCCGPQGLDKCPANQKMCIEPLTCNQDYCCAADCSQLNQFERTCFITYSVHLARGFPTNAPPTLSPYTAAPSSDDGLSGGAIFLILFFSFTAAYLIIGCGVKWINGVKQFPQMLPHYAFWCELPSFIKEGWYFLGAKLCGGSQRNQSVFAGEQYSEAPRDTMGQDQDQQESFAKSSGSNVQGYSTL